jgi:hypothetical protein
MITQTHYWVPEDCMFSNAGDCLDEYPDLGAAALVVSHVAYDELKAQAERLAELLEEALDEIEGCGAHREFKRSDYYLESDSK